MAEPLKNLYNQAFYTQFHLILNQVVRCDLEVFLDKIFNNSWENLELKERMKHTTRVLSEYLSTDFSEAVKQIVSVVELVEKHHPGKALEYMFLPDYIEHFGQDYWDDAMYGMERVTQYTSCEFAIRPFLITDQDKGMQQMLQWSNHSHHAVRRQASEGCRPRLPWAMALPSLKKDPSSIFPILENLKADESEYVRKSVANNLNDIAKDHPDLVLDLAEKWIGKKSGTDWIVKHGCRTLLKQGNIRAMRLFGFGDVEQIEIANLELVNEKVQFGTGLDFSFTLINKSKKDALLRLEYAIYYQKANGSLTPKVYKISEKEYKAVSESLVNKVQPFKPISTRKFHPGLHQLAIIINGVELVRKDFELTM